MRAAVVALTALAGTALADGSSSRTLGDGYALVIQNYGVHVVKGKQRARLAEGIDIINIKIDKRAKQVVADVTDSSCEGDHTYTWTFGQLDARLENTSAYALHKKKDYAAAAAGFARAVAADPKWEIAAYNLASAQQLGGDKDAAIKTLAPWLAAAPIPTYVQVTSDAELAPLLDRPELKAIRAATPGTATITAAHEIDGGVAYAKDRGLIAVARQEASWGGCGFGIDLELRDVKTAAVVARTPIVQWSETSECGVAESPGIAKRARPAIAKRITALNAMLKELGFVKLKTEKGVSVPNDGSKSTYRFPRAKIGLVGTEGTARALIKDKDLGTAPMLRMIRDAVYVEDPKLVVVWSLRPGREGCEGTDPTDVSIIAL